MKLKNVSRAANQAFWPHPEKTDLGIREVPAFFGLIKTNSAPKWQFRLFFPGPGFQGSMGWQFRS